MVQKFTVCRDEQWYLAWPDVALTPSGRLICVFAECVHHGDRSYTRVMLVDSFDRGRTWSAKRPLTEPAHAPDPYWNCPRISLLRDGRLAVVVDRIRGSESHTKVGSQCNYLFFSSDEGRTWSAPSLTPAEGIVPDRICEMVNGRWLLSCHYHDSEFDNLVQRLWYSDDQGLTWSKPVIVGRKKGLNLCEASILEIERDVLVAFHRENSGAGWDCFKTISHDAGHTWSEPIAFPLPGCHRPVAGFLHDGRIMITYRFMQGGRGWLGTWTQNFFAAITDRVSALALTRQDAWTRILPMDFDRSANSDLGYSGWVQFPDDEIYVVNYIVDDWPRGQIRGYSLYPDDFMLPSGSAGM